LGVEPSWLSRKPKCVAKFGLRNMFSTLAETILVIGRTKKGISGPFKAD